MVAVNAQDEVQLQINDTLYFDVCNGESFKYIDYYKKSRFENDSVDFDTTQGWFFYNTYFDSGDFDVTRMPCSLSGDYGIIKHIMNIKAQDGTEQTVVIALIDHGNAAAYIIADAFLSEEILYAPKHKQ
ncbi:MAG: hypothetical protein COA58_03545 [Bacteroidetes bacterium]|nr:MAG: hypothetical protein COA58_03545 [Bacteroidota bacterium]